MLWGIATAMGPITKNSQWHLIGQAEEVHQRKEVRWQVEAPAMLTQKAMTV